MAASIALDSPLSPETVAVPPHFQMAPEQHALLSGKRTVPRNIPSPVSIPLRSDSSFVATSASSATSNTPTPYLSSPASSSHLSPTPLPMPDFVFPARPSTATTAPYSPRNASRRPKSVADLHERTTAAAGGFRHDDRPSRSPALPDFSFNPGASLPSTPDHAFLSPPHSPQSLRAVPMRPAGAGHRRGGSEFVGGNMRSGDAYTLLSTSPTRSESGLPSPSPSSLSPALSPADASRASPKNPMAGPPGPSGPPHGRRGHAHRRSAAISSHDLSDILQPTNPASTLRGNSAPSSPAGFDDGQRRFVFPRPPDSGADRISSEHPVSPLAAATASADSPMSLAVPASPTTTVSAAAVDELQRPVSASKATARARVGFSDTLEFIPRPLSLVSTDTSSTITARPGHGPTTGGHSVSGSISSILSLNSSGTPVSDMDGLSPVARSSSRGALPESRPSTAGAVLERSQSITADENGDSSTSPRRRNSIPLLATIPSHTETADDGSAAAASALPSPSRTPKRWSFFSLDPFIGIGSSSPMRPKTASGGSAAGESAAVDAVGPSVAEGVRDGVDGSGKCAAQDAKCGSQSPAKPSVLRKSSSKKKKKVKSWGILTRKSKPRRKSRRAPTPPPILRPADSDEEDASLDGAQTNVAHFPIQEMRETLTLSPPTLLITPSDSPAEPVDSTLSWRPLPSPSLSAPDDDASLSMIDLDAALGPFNTPLPRNAEWEAAQRAGGMSKRQLHSAAGMTRFSGPGMHYSHRRAESAPEMPPFNRAGLPRYSSSAAMADVFEEDEEEEADVDGSDQKAVSGSDDGSEKPQSLYSAVSTAEGSVIVSPTADEPALAATANSIDIRVTSMDGDEDVSVDRALDTSTAGSDDAASSIVLSRRGSGLSGMSDDDKTQPSTGLLSEYSASSLHDDTMDDEVRSYSFDVPDSGCDIAVDGASESTINSPGQTRKGRDQADVSPLHLPTTASLAPVSPYSLAASSNCPSPRSPMSLDANRISTAPSSVADDFRSLLLGEPGPELRRSLDVPSLASSTSNTTRDSGVFPLPKAPRLSGEAQPRPYLPSRGMERPASFSSTAFGRRRSSLASLHRLINTSHGERSKLSIEVPLENNLSGSSDPEKRSTKVSRTKRLSRMMQFWRAKDEASS